MRSALRFPLADVLVLAEHAITAPGHGTPVGGEPAGPALLLVADDGIYLMSNGTPQLPPAEGQPATSSVRVVFAEGCGAGTDWTEQVDTGSFDDLLVGLPLHQPADRPLIDLLHTATDDGFDTLTISLSAGRVTVDFAQGRPEAGG